MGQLPRDVVARLQQAGREGSALIDVTVEVEGLPSIIVLENSSGNPSLDEAAIEAVKSARFAEAVGAGRGHRCVHRSDPFRPPVGVLELPIGGSIALDHQPGPASITYECKGTCMRLISPFRSR